LLLTVVDFGERRNPQEGHTMKFIARLALFAALLLATSVRADEVGLDLSGTSPAAPSTVVGATSSTRIGSYSTCSVYVAARGATGGPLDIVIQTLFKQTNVSPGMWVDVAHLPQQAAAGALTGYSFTLTRWSTTATIFTPLNTVSGTPVLAVNTVAPGILGQQLRVVYIAGALTTAGAAQTILVTCSD
jgi:hypothetical protein